MKGLLEPLVSVVTPVYNGARYLGECIESVMEQKYQNWEYIIVDNCSTDKSWEIASRYASRDCRLRVHRNAAHVGIIENHNVAFTLISRESEYCKVVSADDYLFPECIQRLVGVAERCPRLGIVGSYSINDAGIRWIGLPPRQSQFQGWEVCRLYLLGAIEAFGTPSTVLYRSSLVRACQGFYRGSLPNADLAACLSCLEYTDFGFVHQILSYERIHCGSISARVKALNGFLIDRLQFVHEYGPRYLESEEMRKRSEEIKDEIYKHLAVNAVHLKGGEFWRYQCRRLQAAGEPVSGIRLARAVCRKLADLLLNPKETVEKLVALRRVEEGSTDTREVGPLPRE